MYIYIYTGIASTLASNSFKLAVITYRSIHGTYGRVSPVSPTWHQDDGCGLLPLIV